MKRVYEFIHSVGNEHSVRGDFSWSRNEVVVRVDCIVGTGDQYEEQKRCVESKGAYEVRESLETIIEYELQTAVGIVVTVRVVQ